MAEEPQLTDFTPDLASPPTNGSHTRRRARFPGGITFGVLLGLLVAVNVVSRVQWLNLGRVGTWSRPAVAAAVAGLMAGGFRRGALRAAAGAGAAAGVIALWVVYGIVRLSTRVIFIERSIAMVVTLDLIMLGLAGAIVGAGAGAISQGARAAFARFAPGAARSAR